MESEIEEDIKRKLTLLLFFIACLIHSPLLLQPLMLNIENICKSEKKREFYFYFSFLNALHLSCSLL